MDIELKTTKYYGATITVKEGGTTIEREIADYKGNSNYAIPESLIENFIQMAWEMHEFNGGNDAEFCTKVIKHCQLSSRDFEEVLEEFPGEVKNSGYVKNDESE